MRVRTSLNYQVFLSQSECHCSGPLTSRDTHSAEETLRKALEIREDILEDGDQALAVTRSNLASVLQRCGRSVEAEDLLRSTLAQVVEKSGRENEAVATAINNLAYLLKHEGRLDESFDHYKEALNIRNKLYEKGHPQIIISLNNLAELCYAKGDEAAGKAYQAEILQILQGKETGEGDKR